MFAAVFKELPQTLRLSLPLIVGNLSMISLGLIDSAMVGAISYVQLAAASLTTNLMSLPYTLLMGFPVAISVLTGIERGRRQPDAAASQMFNGLYVSLLAGTLLAALCLILSPYVPLLRQDPEVTKLAIPYFQVMALSLLPSAVFSSLKHFSDGLEFTRTGMLISLLSIPCNALLNYIFIYGAWGIPRMELLGAGIATLLTRIIMAVIMAAIIFRHHAYREYVAHWRQSARWHAHHVKEILHIGIPSSLQMVLETAAFAVSGIMIGWLGATVQAAHQIALNCASTTFMMLLGLSLGASIRVSHAFGQGNRPLQRSIGVSTLAAGVIWGVFCLVMFTTLRWQLPYLFNDDPQVVAMAAGLFVVAGVFQVSDSLQGIGAGLCRGIRDVKTPTVLIGIAYWVIGIPVGYVLAFPLGMGAYGIWWGFVAGLSMSAIFLNVRFLGRVDKAIGTA